jgi:ABC-type cobalamin/Fe3+-siderophores transport system ATPase subunit
LGFDQRDRHVDLCTFVLEGAIERLDQQVRLLLNVCVTGQVAFVPQLFQVSLVYSALDMVLMGRAIKS